MTIDQERTYIMAHPKYKHSVKWIARCMRMPDAQVHAIYKQFQKADYKAIEKKLKLQEKDNEHYHQMTIFDFLKGE